MEQGLISLWDDGTLGRWEFGIGRQIGIVNHCPNYKYQESSLRVIKSTDSESENDNGFSSRSHAELVSAPHLLSVHLVKNLPYGVLKQVQYDFSFITCHG